MNLKKTSKQIVAAMCIVMILAGLTPVGQSGGVLARGISIDASDMGLSILSNQGAGQHAGILSHSDGDSNSGSGDISIDVLTCHSLTLGHTGSGSDPEATSVSNSCSIGMYIEGEPIQLEGALPDPGWTIGGWTGTNNDASTSDINQATMPDSDLTVTVNYVELNPTPTITSISPSAIMAGSGEFILSINGTGFITDSIINMNGSPLTTTFVNTSQLTAQIGSSFLTTMGSFPITVENPGPGGGISNQMALAIYTFADVLPGSWYYGWVEGFFAKGITTGCNIAPLRYCPDRAVTRAEMAVFILRSIHVNSLPYTPNPDPADVGIFADVPTPGKEWMGPWIEEFYGTGMTTGCALNPFRYCPERQVTRAEMAVFILRAIHGASYQPPAITTSSFSDLPVAGKEWMMPWIEEFYTEGLTTGCKQVPTLQYCPEQSVTRAEMATFLDRAFGFPQLP